MAPTRRSRRSSGHSLPQPPAQFKTGDYVEFQFNGNPTTGRLLDKPSDTHWTVAPSDRRRKNELLPESQLRKMDAVAGRAKRREEMSGSENERNEDASQEKTVRVGTRSKRGNLLVVEEAPTKKREKRVFGKRDRSCVRVEMLTGTLYLYRGERPRAEFVRSKY